MRLALVVLFAHKDATRLAPFLMTGVLGGFNVGASTTFRVGGIFGIDFGVRYSRATVRVEPSEGRELEFDAGGLRIGAGLRLLIP